MRERENERERERERESSGYAVHVLYHQTHLLVLDDVHAVTGPVCQEVVIASSRCLYPACPVPLCTTPDTCTASIEKALSASFLVYMWWDCMYLVRQVKIGAYLLTWFFGVLPMSHGMEPPIHHPNITIDHCIRRHGSTNHHRSCDRFV